MLYKCIHAPCSSPYFLVCKKRELCVRPWLSPAYYNSRRRKRCHSRKAKVKIPILHRVSLHSLRYSLSPSCNKTLHFYIYIILFTSMDPRPPVQQQPSLPAPGPSS